MMGEIIARKTDLRLCRSMSSDTLSMAHMCISGLCDSRTEELDDSTVVVLELWNVLNEN